MSSKKAIQSNTIINTTSNNANNATHDCSCGKQYKHKQSLLTHQKKCNNNDPQNQVQQQGHNETPQYVDENNVPITNEMINNIINENKQLRLILLAYIKTLKDVKAMAIEQQRLRNGGDNEDNGDQEEGEEENESQ